jgi:hypothetical protein
LGLYQDIVPTDYSSGEAIPAKNSNVRVAQPFERVTFSEPEPLPFEMSLLRIKSTAGWFKKLPMGHKEKP